MMLLTKVFLLLGLVVLEKAGAEFEADEVGWGPQIGGLDQNGGGWGQNGGGWWSPDTKASCTCKYGKSLCRPEGRCEVDCNSKCRDLQNGITIGSCTSVQACSQNDRIWGHIWGRNNGRWGPNDVRWGPNDVRWGPNDGGFGSPDTKASCTCKNG